ncbi:SGNH/GDSL hydrolase family protein [Pseudobacteroides cellulosolvens]|uniref:SGNH hydrolase-type esterase domain-containing protein n=1 Tax=Pseudobacteroides cellulosolvens ATCC 35603 = DSM 2933 TaxID=398512 RepID=A0A0L6JLP2_9FIRM|nr:SGNH/GDSL hydrolase family protein [Pseudobacteroides cellulosolvens]KNY26689.1 hypothetical protein Bccel_1954 [Pseudobacteroides cellulosolvens ATCC 35603 = DSM 2933]
MDVHDVSIGIEDNWIFYGDSITAGGMAPNGTGTGTFAQMINKIKPGNFPIAEGGSARAILSSHGAANISTWLSVFPGKYVGLTYGTNDAWGNQAGASTYCKNMETMVKAIIAAGKVPVISKIPYSKNQDISKYAPSYNDQIDAIYKDYPAIVKGPDLWTYFQSNPNFRHPNS